MQHEIYKERIKQSSIVAKDGMIETFDESILLGLAARVIKDSRLGFAYSTASDLNDKELIEAAAKVAECSEKDRDFLFPEADHGRIKNNNNDGQDLSMDEKKDLVLRLEASARAFDKRIKTVRQPMYEEYAAEINILNSNDLNIKFSRQLSYLQITAVASVNGESEWATEEEFSLTPGNLKVEETARVAAERAISYLKARKLSSRKCPSILDSRVVMQMLKITAQAFLASSVYKKRSPIADKEGKQIYSSHITIVDDATLKDSFSRIPYDAEGVPVRKVTVVDKGRLNTFLYDTYYAKKMGRSSTASCVRESVMQLPCLGIQNLYILPGEDSQADIIKKMGKGLFVTSLLGLHTANPVTGDFSVGAVGFWIENGQKVHSVKGVTIAGNLHAILSKVAAVGSDLRFSHLCGAPSLLVEEVAIAGS